MHLCHRFAVSLSDIYPRYARLPDQGVRFCSSNETLFLISVFFVDILRQYQRRLLPILMTSYIWFILLNRLY